MSLEGMTKVKKALIGNIHLLKKVSGYSAYDLAVANGFKGTLAEWLASLRGADGYTPQKGVDYDDGEKGDPGTLENHSGIDALNLPIVNVADPTNDTDAVNKKYAEENFAAAVKSITVSLNADAYGIADTTLNAEKTVILGARVADTSINGEIVVGLPFQNTSGNWNVIFYNPSDNGRLDYYRSSPVTFLYIEI